MEANELLPGRVNDLNTRGTFSCALSFIKHVRTIPLYWAQLNAKYF